jgi:hypothetical protein
VPVKISDIIKITFVANSVFIDITKGTFCLVNNSILDMHIIFSISHRERFYL